MKDEIKEILDYLNIKGKKMMGIKQKELLLDYITNLQDRIEELEQINEEHRKINGELRERIDKAIEYIKSTQLYGMRSGKTLYSKVMGETINILQGSDE